MRNKSHTRGFTLTELMVVILILGIISAIGAPAMGRFLQSWRLNGEANQMATTLRLARTAAVTKNTNVVFVFDVNAGEYYYIEDDDGSGAQNGNEYESETHELPPGVTLARFSMGQQWITFGPKGNTIDGGEIVLGNSRNATRRIRVFSGTGNVIID